MDEDTDTVWAIKPHTKAKHEVLRRYLGAWFPIMKRVNPTGLNYIDGFAGPGTYSGGEEGSPIIAIQTAVRHILPMPAISFVFVEKNRERVAHLKSVLAERFPDLPKNIDYEVHHGEFTSVVGGILDDFDAQDKTIAPTLTFIDPFGYGGFPMALLRRLLETRSCEVLITFMCSRLRRFLDETHEDVIDSLFDSKEWRAAREMQDQERMQFLLDLYTRNLLSRTPARYVLTFEMIGRDGNTIYWLVFATTHPKGCDVMKEAMWKVDQTGTYRFYDAAAGVRRFLLDEDDPKWAKQAQELIWQHFKGRGVFVEDLEDFIRPTDFIWRRKKILIPLERAGKIVNVADRKRKFTYPPGCFIKFSN